MLSNKPGTQRETLFSFISGNYKDKNKNTSKNITVERLGGSREEQEAMWSTPRRGSHMTCLLVILLGWVWSFVNSSWNCLLSSFSLSFFHLILHTGQVIVTMQGFWDSACDLCWICLPHICLPLVTQYTLFIILYTTFLHSYNLFK